MLKILISTIFIIFIYKFNTFSQYNELVLFGNKDTFEIDNNILEYEYLVPRNIKNYQTDAVTPLFIIFDMQNEWGYKHILTSIDYMISIGNIPNSCILGISFKEENRKYLTTYKAEGGGLEIFTDKLIEMIDSVKFIKSSFTPIILIGHSRTAYLSIQMLINKSRKINAVFASSPWQFEPNEKRKFIEFSKSLTNKRYLFTNSGSRMFLDTEKEYMELQNFLLQNSMPNLVLDFKIENTDHILSRNINFIQHTSNLFYHYLKMIYKNLENFNEGNFSFEDYCEIIDNASDSSGFRLQVDDVTIHSGFSILEKKWIQNKVKEKEVKEFMKILTMYSDVVQDPYCYLLLLKSSMMIKGEEISSYYYLIKALQSSDNYLWESNEDKKDFLEDLIRQYFLFYFKN